MFNSGISPQLIIQNYYLSSDGYAIRIRASSMFSNVECKMNESTNPIEIIDKYYDCFDIAQMTVKGPSAGGSRYEVEQSLDPIVAKELIKRGGKSIIKNRYSAWIGNDGWVLDVFGGENTGLIIAECERTSPVTDLEIPDFCVIEITDDVRFANDTLVNHPYSEFATDFANELSELDSELKKGVGYNTGKLRVRQNMYSQHFGNNRFL